MEKLKLIAGWALVVLGGVALFFFAWAALWLGYYLGFTM